MYMIYLYEANKEQLISYLIKFYLNSHKLISLLHIPTFNNSCYIRMDSYQEDIQLVIVSIISFSICDQILENFQITCCISNYFYISACIYVFTNNPQLCKYLRFSAIDAIQDVQLYGFCIVANFLCEIYIAIIMISYKMLW